MIYVPDYDPKWVNPAAVREKAETAKAIILELRDKLATESIDMSGLAHLGPAIELTDLYDKVIPFIVGRFFEALEAASVEHILKTAEIRMFPNEAVRKNMQTVP